MQVSNIATSARGQVAANLWDELMQAAPDADIMQLVQSNVDFVAGGMMQFYDLAGYIAVNQLEFHTPQGEPDPFGDTPTSFLRRVVRDDLTRYIMEKALPRHLATRERNFVWNATTLRWNVR